MKITKELLEHLKVNSFSLEKDGRDILCHLDRVEKGLWTFTLPNAQNLRIGEIAEVTVLFEREEMTSVLYAEIKDFPIPPAVDPNLPLMKREKMEKKMGLDKKKKKYLYEDEL